MTVSVQQPFTASVASGATTVFPYGFKVAHADDLSVSLDGVLQTTGYSVTGVGDDAGGDVIFDVAPASAVKVLRYLDPVLNRQTDYQQFGDWAASVVNNDFDRLWLAIQAVAQNTSRSLKLPVDTADNQEITADAATRANKGIRFDADGNLVISLYDPDASGSYADAAYSYAETAEAAQASAVNAKVDAEISAAEAAASAASVDAANLLTKAGNLSGLANKATARSNLDLVIGTHVQAYYADIPTVAGSQSEWEAGTETELRSGSPANIAQAIAAQATLKGSSSAVSASGTSVDFTSIPTWARRISVTLSNISTNGTSLLLVQIGDSGGMETTGYTGCAQRGTAFTAFSTGFVLDSGATAAWAVRGRVELELVHATSNTWVLVGLLGLTGGTFTSNAAGEKSLSAALDRVRVTTVNGTDTFDAGLLAISYEG